MIFCCPYCHRELARFDSLIRCYLCGVDYRYEHGIYYFFDPDAEHWQKIQRANHSFTNETDDIPKDYINFMPVTDYPYITDDMILEGKMDNQKILASNANGAMLNYVFDLIYGQLINKDNLPILNIGASDSWESYFFARYKPVIAMNVNEHVRWIDPDYGKGITRVVADGHYLPFCNESVGIIFMCSTYHHMEDKDRALKEWYRVLVSGGVLVAIGEYYTPIADKYNMIDQGEYNYTLEEMRQTFSDSQFRAIELFPIQYGKNMQYKLALELTGTNIVNGIIIGVK